MNVLKQYPNMALATKNRAGYLNVVPVSVLEIDEGKVLLFDFFMDKSRQNIQDTGTVALTCWYGLDGFQVKGHACYISSGSIFEKYLPIMHEKFPNRILRGVISITVTESHSVAPDRVC